MSVLETLGMNEWTGQTNGVSAIEERKIPHKLGFVIVPNHTPALHKLLPSLIELLCNGFDFSHGQLRDMIPFFLQPMKKIAEVRQRLSSGIHNFQHAPP